MEKTPKIVKKDNGYFEIWEKPNGEQVRVTTEYLQYSFRSNRDARRKFHNDVRERLSA